MEFALEEAIQCFVLEAPVLSREPRKVELFRRFGRKGKLERKMEDEGEMVAEMRAVRHPGGVIDILLVAQFLNFGVEGGL